MQWIFLHKTIPVAEIIIDDATGMIQKISKVYAPEHLPVGIPIHKGVINRAAFNEWWTDRSIPASRMGVREARKTLDTNNTLLLLTRCCGLSLSDQYWICPKDAKLRWEDINFFDNSFSGDIGDILFGEYQKDDIPDFHSPDITTDGNLKKRWMLLDGRPCLVKGGSEPFCQQPFNEVIATKIMQRLDIPHIPYTVIWDHGAPYSVCEDFVRGDTELVPAWRIFQLRKRNNSTSLYRHFVDCCASVGIPDVVPFLDRMIVLDYILANEDRHLNNFGALRHAETLEWIGMAPIYDSGTALGYDKPPAQMRSEKNVICKPFKNHHEEQLKLVTSFDWIRFDRLSDMKDVVTEVLSDKNASGYMEESRIRAIAAGVERRIDNLKRLAAKQMTVQDSTKDDVLENIAEHYNGGGE